MTSVKMELENISFTYDSSPVLKDLSLCIQESDFIGLIGPNGSGKTTLLRVLNGHITPAQGDVYVGSESITQLSAHQISKKIAVVPQDTVLFNDTISNNIKYGKLNASYEEIKNVAKLAGITEFSDTLEKKLETIIGESGIKFDVFFSKFLSKLLNFPP